MFLGEEVVGPHFPEHDVGVVDDDGRGLLEHCQAAAFLVGLVVLLKEGGVEAVFPVLDEQVVGREDFGSGVLFEEFPGPGAFAAAGDAAHEDEFHGIFPRTMAFMAKFYFRESFTLPLSQEFVKPGFFLKPDLLKAGSHDALVVVVEVCPLDELSLLAD